MISTVTAITVPYDGYLLLLTADGTILGISEYAAADWGLSESCTIDGEPVNIYDLDDSLSKAIAKALTQAEKYLGDF